MSALCAIPAALLYLAASLFAIFESWRDNRALRQWANRLFLIGVLLHSAYLLSIATRYMQWATVERWQSLAFVAWVVAIGYVVLLRNARWQHFAIVYLPMIFLFFFASLIEQPANLAGAMVPESWGIAVPRVLPVHLGAALTAVAIFVVSFINGLLYLYKEQRLKSKDLDAKLLSSPALPILARTVTRLLLCGFLALTITVATGLWMHRDTPLQVHSWISLAAWVIYGVVLQGQWSRVQHARRWIFLSLVGCVVIVVSFLEVHQL